MLLNNPQFFEEKCLLKKQTSLPINIFNPNDVTSELLQFL